MMARCMAFAQQKEKERGDRKTSQVESSPPPLPPEEPPALPQEKGRYTMESTKRPDKDAEKQPEPERAQQAILGSGFQFSWLRGGHDQDRPAAASNCHAAAANAAKIETVHQDSPLGKACQSVLIADTRELSWMRASTDQDPAPHGSGSAGVHATKPVETVHQDSPLGKVLQSVMDTEKSDHPNPQLQEHLSQALMLTFGASDQQFKGGKGAMSSSQEAADSSFGLFKGGKGPLPVGKGDTPQFPEDNPQDGHDNAFHSMFKGGKGFKGGKRVNADEFLQDDASTSSASYQQFNGGKGATNSSQEDLETAVDSPELQSKARPPQPPLSLQDPPSVSTARVIPPRWNSREAESAGPSTAPVPPSGSSITQAALAALQRSGLQLAPQDRKPSHPSAAPKAFVKQWTEEEPWSWKGQVYGPDSLKQNGKQHQEDEKWEQDERDDGRWKESDRQTWKEEKDDEKWEEVKEEEVWEKEEADKSWNEEKDEEKWEVEEEEGKEQEKLEEEREDEQWEEGADEKTWKKEEEHKTWEEAQEAEEAEEAKEAKQDEQLEEQWEEESEDEEDWNWDTRAPDVKEASLKRKKVKTSIKGKKGWLLWLSDEEASPKGKGALLDEEMMKAKAMPTKPKALPKRRPSAPSLRGPMPKQRPAKPSCSRLLLGLLHIRHRSTYYRTAGKKNGI
eukprot:g17373.t1